MKAMRSPIHNTTRAGGSQPDLSKLNSAPFRTASNFKETKTTVVL